MKLIFLCCEHQCRDFAKACKKLEYDAKFIGVKDIASEEGMAAAYKQLEIASHSKENIILFANDLMDKNAENFYVNLPKNAAAIIPVGADAILLNAPYADKYLIDVVNKYVLFGGSSNFENALKFLDKEICGGDVSYDLPMEMPFEGIYDIENLKIYSTLADYFAVVGRKYQHYVGILSHRSSYVGDDLAVEIAIAKALNSKGIGTICAYSYGESADGSTFGFDKVISRFFSLDGDLQIKSLVNFQMFLLRGRDGKTLSEVAIEEFSKLNIPIYSPINSYTLTETTWQNANNPLAIDGGHSIINAEMAGMIEPILLGVYENDCHRPILNRVEHFVGRVEKYLKLATTNNQDKKVVIMLHNDVCAGVEATVGKAYGLDAFGSVLSIMKSLSASGYELSTLPKTAKELYDLIMSKKAYSDFRWTSALDIDASGGVLYKMPTDEYMEYFKKLPIDLQESMIATYGDAPGEGMVIDEDILVTGVDFGSVLLMVQPKRGCYGAKCTGEICKILHDPFCPVPHQYLATYRFVEEVFGANAVIHVGTDGSLEYLPGKSNAQSENCLSNTVLNSLPNFYLYHSGVASEALVAKRRANAVLLGYLPVSKSGLSERMRIIVDKIAEYLEACNQNNGQESELQQKILALLAEGTDIVWNEQQSFGEFVTELRAVAYATLKNGQVEAKHTFAALPTLAESANFILEIWQGEEKLDIAKMEDYEFLQHFEDDLVLALSGENVAEFEMQYPDLLSDAKMLYEKLQQTDVEMLSLLNGLNGGYVQAGESGMAEENGRKVIPTGKNFYAVNVDKIPTKIAYERGKIMAEQLLDAYMADECKYPEKIAMNMISSDITRTNGEQLSQMLNLIGVTPVWDNMGKVKGLEAIDLQELGRPRIDVTVRISGVLRDTWAFAVNMMDDAVMLVAILDEDAKDNYIVKNNLDCDILDGRGKNIRIFGDPPGTFGSGLDLALKASAWETDEDLAKYFISYSAFAYGNELQGEKKVAEFVENAKKVEVTCDSISSKRMNMLSNHFSTEVQGGFSLLAKTLGKKKPKQYQNLNIKGKEVGITTFAEEMAKNIDETLLNPIWQENIKNSGYEGASDIMKQMQNVFQAQCLTEDIADETLDKLTDCYMNNEKMRQWLVDNNKFAAEEIGRRMLELESRGKWQADEEVLDNLKMAYLSIEGDLEGGLNGLGEIQGGSIEIIRHTEVEAWQNNLNEIEKYLMK